MQIVTVYLGNDRERKRRDKKKNAFVVLAASVIAVVALAGRTPPPVVAETRIPAEAPVATPQVVEKIVYVDRPILAYADPVGPPAPVIAPAVEPAKPTPPQKTPGRRERVPQKVQPPPPPQVVTTIAPPPQKPAPRPIYERLPPVIEPRQIHFGLFGSRRKAVTISNPHPVPLKINSIEMATQDGTNLEGFELEGQEKCIKSLQPAERCQFHLRSRTRNGGVTIRVYYDPAVVGMTP